VTPFPDADVRAELNRILESKGFATASRMKRLLRYVVDKTLSGEADQLKEYAVGLEVFDRDESYDPRIDSIVRVEAGRLRSRLEEYYAGEGARSTLRISLPRGGYMARFERRPVEESPAPIPAPSMATWRTWPYALALLAAIGALVAWLAMQDRGPKPDLRPTAAVMPVQANMIGGDNDNYSAQMTEALTTELARLGPISVASFTSAMQFADKHPSMSEAAAALRSRYMVEASVDDEASEILVVARIVDATTDRKMWVQDYRGPREDVRGIAQRIAFDISAAILAREAGR
jgi:TolB-like protein